MSEQEHATRRAPHMEKYVEIRTYPGDPDAYAIILKVGNQGFRLEPVCEQLAEAEWFRDMLCIALDNIVKDADK